MKVSKKNTADGKILLQATATAAEVINALDAAQIAFAQSMGIRPEQGKSVPQLVEEQMGVKDLDSIVQAGAQEALVPLALDAKNLVPLYPPTPSPKSAFKRGQEFRFELEVEPKPEYELTSYDPISIKIPEFQLDESVVDAEIDKMADNYKAFIADSDSPEGRKVQKGDHVRIAMKAFEDGEEMTQLSTDGRTYTAGEGYMPEGFENEVLGMEAGETKEFTFDGPDFDKDFNPITKKVDATVTVLEFQKEEKPIIDDAWVQKNMPIYRGLAELRADIKRNLTKQGRDQYDDYVRQIAAEEAAKRFQGKIPDEAYEAMRENLLAQYRQGLKQQGKTWEEFVEENGGDQQIGMMMMLQVRQMLVTGFVLDAIFRHQKMTLTDDDVLEACRAMNPQADPKAMREQMEKSGRGFAMRESAERLKANKWLVETANIEYQSAE
ncbi:trigger factor [Adlercreutzia sp. ZJ304]|uniref:trigger factor n=1 Tax=Adlercreutzia sp. ZJ304 TaxID=2709791 RepID=UPI0013EB720F|nr:trigger factor [Adlercreutzia sp. ZJ304]